MTDKLPGNLLALFTARPPLRFLQPRDAAPADRRTAPITGIGPYVDLLREEAANSTYQPTESWLEQKDRVKEEKKERQIKLVNEDYKTLYKPHEDSQIRGTGFETLFVSRLSYKTSVNDLRDHFGRFGRIDRIRVVAGSGKGDKKHAGLSRGYAFIQFEREEDMKAAYKQSENLMLDGRKVVVDVERGRTVANWKPRRFGGGLGGRHYTRVPKPSFGSFGGGPPMGPGGGFRGGRGGGFRGGFRGDRGGYNDRPRFGGGRYGDERSGGYRGGAPDGAPAGPRSGHGGGGGGGGGGYDRGYGGQNANHEPVQPRGGFRDRDQGGYGRDDRGSGRQNY